MPSILKTSLGQIEYTVHGKNTGCNAICILHGAGGSYKQGELIGRTFIAEDKHYVICISRPGYGASFVKGAEQPNLKQQSDLIKRFLVKLLATNFPTTHLSRKSSAKTQEVSQFGLVGWSAGADVALTMARDYPEFVSRLVVESVGVFPNSLSPPGIGVEILASGDDVVGSLLQSTIQATKIVGNQAAELLLQIVFGADSTKLSKSRVKFVMEDTNKSKLNFLYAFLDTFFPLSEKKFGFLADITNARNFWSEKILSRFPFATLRGRRCQIVEATTDASGWIKPAKFIHKKIKGSKLQSIKKSGHLLWLSKYYVPVVL